jgi:hypothetical protein
MSHEIYIMQDKDNPDVWYVIKVFDALHPPVMYVMVTEEVATLITDKVIGERWEISREFSSCIRSIYRS